MVVLFSWKLICGSPSAAVLLISIEVVDPEDSISSSTVGELVPIPTWELRLNEDRDNMDITTKTFIK